MSEIYSIATLICSGPQACLFFQEQLGELKAQLDTVIQENERWGWLGTPPPMPPGILVTGTMWIWDPWLT